MKWESTNNLSMKLEINMKATISMQIISGSFQTAAFVFLKANGKE
jgi:hypothetical protein